MLSKATRKYLSRYAAEETALAATLSPQRPWSELMVIPACDEAPSLLEGILPACRPSTLVIVVVNGRDGHSTAVHENNRAVLDQLRDGDSTELPGSALSQIDGTDVLVIDRASEGRRLPAREGVGLARKIGCDVGLALRSAGKLTGRWLHMSDGDVQLPLDYFSSATAQEAVGLAYRFRHVPSGDAALDRAHAVYEIYLRYYVLGLRWAGSRYAIHTIGSTLAIDVDAYAQVRGVPRRQAGEDFYLVNKLLKLGDVAVPNSAPIAIRARRSERVPFGTGRATGDMLRDHPDGDSYAVYHPRAFVALRCALNALEALAERGTLTALERLDDPLAAVGFEALEARAALARELSQAKEAPARQARIHHWFDAFRTLRFIHAVRDAGAGTMPWRDALHSAQFTGSNHADDAPATICTQLAQLDEAVTSWHHRL